MKQITIYDLLPILKKGWVAMDRDGTWWWSKYKLICRTTFGEWASEYMANTFYYESLYPFNIAPYQGDWKDSLIKVEHKEEE